MDGVVGLLVDGQLAVGGFLLRAAAETVHRVAAAVLADLDQTDPHETAA